MARRCCRQTHVADIVRLTAHSANSGFGVEYVSYMEADLIFLNGVFSLLPLD